MKNLVRGGVILSVLSLFVVFIYAQTKTNNEPKTVKDPQSQLNNKETNKETEKVIETAVTEKNKDTKEAEPNAETGSEEGQDNATNRGIKRTVSSRASGLSKARFVATAYCLRGRTASGTGVRRGIIAADPRVLPLGTRVSLGAGGQSGSYVVADTGGKIKGRKIDIWMASCSEARRFGRRNVTLSVLN